MENVVLFIILALALIVAFFTLILIAHKNYIYVHTKTGNRYRIIQKCLMKIDGTWKDAIVDISEKNGEVYVREYSDFITNFERLSKWKENQ